MAIDAGTVYYTVDSKTEQAISGIDKVKDSVDATGKSLKTLDTNVTKTATAVNSGMSRMGRSAGQAGIQIQQFIGQIQGGQSAMLALSQQSADLGFVLGAPLLGAVVGIGASIAGMLLPNLFKTTDSLEDVEKATERVRAAITLSAEGVTGYSDKMKVLSQVSESLARIQLANIIADQANAMKVALNGVGEEFDKAFDKPWSTYESNVRDLFGEASFSAFEAAAALKSASGALSSGVDEQKINDLAEALQKAKNAGIQTTESGRQLTSTMANLIAEYKLGELTISQLKEQLDGTKLSFDDAAESATKYDNLLKRLTIRSNETKTAQLEQEKALVMLEKGFQELAPEKQQAIADAYDLVIANTREAESEKALAKAKRETAAAERESQKASKAFIQNFGVEGDDFADPSDPDSVATSYSRDITDTYNPETKLEQLQRERDMILMFQEMERGDAQTHAEALMAIDEQIEKERQKGIENTISSFDSLESAGQRALTSVLNGTMSANEALYNLGQTIANEAISSLVELGVQYVKNQLLGESAAAASAATAAVTGSTIAAAYAPAATAASIATQGGAVAAGQAAMASGVPAMNGLLLAGGRQYGGPVAANSMYRINENGAPEVFNAANGQQYMLPNTRGEVVSNKDASGGGNTYITVQVNSDGTATTNGGSAMQQFGTEIGQFVEAKFRELETKSMRQGGAIWQYSQKGRR